MVEMQWTYRGVSSENGLTPLYAGASSRIAMSGDTCRVFSNMLEVVNDFRGCGDPESPRLSVVTCTDIPWKVQWGRA
jgi:hypothetical protein